MYIPNRMDHIYCEDIIKPYPPTDMTYNNFDSFVCESLPPNWTEMLCFKLNNIIQLGLISFC